MDSNNHYQATAGSRNLSYGELLSSFYDFVSGLNRAQLHVSLSQQLQHDTEPSFPVDC